MKNILFRDDQSLLGSNWYTLSKKLFIIPFILSFIGLLAIYSLIGTEYSILLLFKHFISFNIFIFITQKKSEKNFKYYVYFFYYTFNFCAIIWI